MLFREDSVLETSQVHVRPLVESRRLPLVITPSSEGIDLAVWLNAHRHDVDHWLVEHGGLLFRGFGVDSAVRFHEVAERWSRALMVYKERSSPRTLVREHVYTSTDYPPDQIIFPPNEHSYASRFPMRIAFCCIVPPPVGGETPLVDCRRLLARIPDAIRRRFSDRGGWMYVRTFHDGVGLPWQTVYQTTDPQVVEEYCRQHDIRCEWTPDDRLKTYQVRPVVSRHPMTGEDIWFNHATFFNVATLPAFLRDGLLEQFGADDVPNNTCYADGSPLEPETLTTLQAAYLAEQVAFPWERGDVLLLDNMLTAHGRNAFEGERTVLVVMSDPIDRRSLPALLT
jgi:alpha-ketoglutarate-dependent taurine dioxygenase